MKHLAAYLLLGLGGNTSPSASDVKEVLSSVGIDADEERLDKLIKELEGKDLQEVCSTPMDMIWKTFLIILRQLIAEGTSKLASVPSGGGGGGAAASSGATAGGAAPAEEAKPAEKEEEKEESDEDMGFGLFD